MAGAMSMSETNRMGMVFFFKKRPPDVAQWLTLRFEKSPHPPLIKGGEQ
jgi:hypothetical protein